MDQATNNNYEKDFDQVAKQEKAWTDKRRQSLNLDTEAPLVGLALSGGGIRSATFNLGVLQALSKTRLLPEVDMVSSVSGGGYIASCFHWIRNHLKPNANTDFTQTPIASQQSSYETETVLDWLRSHGNYLIAGKGFSYWQLIASIIAGTLLNLFVLLPLFVLIIWGATLEWLPIEWPQLLSLSSSEPLNHHDGFLLLLILGHVSFVAYLLTVFLFALTGLFSPLRKLTQQFFFRRLMGRLLGLSVALVAIGLVPFFADLELWVEQQFSSESLTDLTRHLTYLVPLISGLLSIRASRNQEKKGQSGKGIAVFGLSLFLYSLLVVLYYAVVHTGIMQSQMYWGWLALSFILAISADVNAISMHSYYRGRLALAYLPAIKPTKDASTAINQAMDFKLHEMTPDKGAPFAIINTTINTTSSKVEKLKARGGDSFMLTPLYCGSSRTGFQKTGHYLKGEMALSTAFSVSGAAVDPNTYATNSRPIAFLMALLNFRLGFWTDNPNPKWCKRSSRSASWYRLMLREMLGLGLSETQPQVHLSDGGHFENLGVYELLRRRCRYIIASDASADLAGTLQDLGKAIQRARADFGVDVKIDVSTLETDNLPASSACRLGKIIYNDGSEGELLYIKAQVQPQLSADVYAYWRNNKTFPDQSTADQFFDEWQFDSYRQLGEQITLALVGDNKDIPGVFSNFKYG